MPKSTDGARSGLKIASVPKLEIVQVFPIDPTSIPLRDPDYFARKRRHIINARRRAAYAVRKRRMSAGASRPPARPA